MRLKMLLLGAVAISALAPMANAQTVIGTLSTGGRRIEGTPDSAAKRVAGKVYEGRFSFVRLEEREPGAALNLHPLSVSPHALRALLASITTAVDGKPEPIFNTEQLDEIAAPLSVALSRALPTQDVTFAVSGQTNGFGLFASRAVSTARVFALDKKLEIIFGLGRRDFENEMRGTGVLIAFEPGQRGKRVSSDLVVQAPQSLQRRADWLGVDVSRLEPSTAQTAVPGQAATIGSTAGTLVAPARAAAPQTAESLYNNLSERFKALQRLRDAGLITDAEYEAKRKSLLGEL